MVAKLIRRKATNSMRKVAQFRVAQYKAYNARLQVSQEVWTKMRRNYSGSDLGGKGGRAGSARPLFGRRTDAVTHGHVG